MARPLNPGDVVRLRGERWRVLHHMTYDDCGVVELAGCDDRNRGEIGRFLIPFDRVHPLADTTEPRIVSRAAWQQVARRVLGDARSTWTGLRAAAKARILLLPFQLEPALAMTRALATRFLLADEVGLGKTIQAALMVAELLERERDAHVLIVTPAGLREQWCDELRNRFAVDATVIDAAALIRQSTQLPDGINPWAVPPIVITSIDFLKRPDVIRSLETLVWDLVVFDEAHGLCGRSDRASAAALIAARGRRVAMLTATPHTGDDHAFARLCALGALETDGELLMFRRSRVNARVPGTRHVRFLAVRPSPAENRMHTALDAYTRRVWHEASVDTVAARLAMIVLGRRACSSAASLARSIERRMSLLDGRLVDTSSQLRLPMDDGYSQDDAEPLAELSAPGIADTAAETSALSAILALAREAAQTQRKLHAIARLLNRRREPAIVFTEYRDTLQELAHWLASGRSIAHLHGGMSVAERTAAVRRFTEGEAELLLATDAASEGLNLHHRCRLVIHLEIPWTPIRFEQRTGRVDRIGQTRRVHSIGLVARGTPEVDVVARLKERQVRARHALDFPISQDVFRADLRVDAEAEAAAMEQARALRRYPGALGADLRPPFAMLAPTRSSAVRLCWAVRLQFVDDRGGLVWHTILGIMASAGPGPHQRYRRELRKWLSERPICRTIDADLADVHAEAVLAFVRELQPVVQRLMNREQAIVDMLRQSKARLASPLLQPGLFDRRAARRAEAQARLESEIATRATARLDALRRVLQPRPGERQVVFIAALPG
jgi:superfamily II DNA or RNA helicase